MSQDDDLWATFFDGQSSPDDANGWTTVHFKWGWNAQTGEASVWRLAGGPDGLPIHEWHLTEAWGRPPSFTAGDLLGIALERSAAVSGGGDVTITPYYGKPVPDSVVDWFKAEFPSHAVQSVEPPATDA